MSDFVRDHISLYEDTDVEFNSLSEDHQDLADKFPKKTDEVLIGNRLRSSIVRNVESLKEKYFFVTINISFN